MLGTGTATPAPSQYVEVFSTLPSYTIPSGVYLVGINGAEPDHDWRSQAGRRAGHLRPGRLHHRRQRLPGVAGEERAVLRPGVKDANGIELANSAVLGGVGFGNGGTSSEYGTLTNVHVGGSHTGKTIGGTTLLATDIAQGSESFLLIQRRRHQPQRPPSTRATRVRRGGAAYTSWNVFDAVGLLGGVNGTAGADHSYAALTFKSSGNTTGTTLAGSATVSTGTWTATDLSRITRNTGLTGAAWLASVPTGSNGLFASIPRRALPSAGSR